MKQLLAIAFSATLFFGITSCRQTENVFCYECTHPNKCAVDICNEQATVDNNGICVLAPDKQGNTNVEYKNAYEAEGYTCRVK